METTDLTPKMLRERMEVKGVTLTELAHEAGMPQPDLSAVLRGRSYCGDERRKRIERAIIKLELDKEPEPEEAEPDEKPPVVFRMSQL